MTKIRSATSPGLLIIVFICLMGPLTAQEDNSGKSQLTVPWDEFKQLLHLEDNQIVLPLETFQKLLAQTGAKVPPPHDTKGGDIILTREEFKALVDKMLPRTGIDVPPPFPYLTTKAIYSGKVAQTNTEFTGTFHVQVLKKDAYLKVPILPQQIALNDILVNGAQALVVTEGGYHHVVLSTPGEHVVEATFSLKSSLVKGPHRLDLSIQPTPVTLLKLELPLEDIDVEIPEAQQIQTSQQGARTFVSATIAPGRNMSVRWRKKTEETEKLPSKLYTEISHLISIDDDALKINTEISYNILHSEMDGFRLTIPEGVNVLSVTGEGVGEWQDVNVQGQRTIRVPFTYSKKGSGTIRMTTESTFADSNMATSFSGIRIPDAVRETGFIGIELNTSAEVRVTDNEGAEKIPVQKLPAQLQAKSAKPLILGFKYLKHPFNLVLDIEKHDKIPVPVATINSASAVTLFTEDGKIVNRLVYEVRNSSKQFLELQLPERAEVWSVFVGKQPAESSINSAGDLLVPLIRSRSTNNNLDTFPVEIIYCVVDEKFTLFDSRDVALPKVDLLTSQLIWSVYLPNDYNYMYFTSTLEKEEIIRGLNLFSSPKREYDKNVMKKLLQPSTDSIREDRAPAVSDLSETELQEAYRDKDYMSKFRNTAIPQEQISSQVGAELEFGGRLEGLQQGLPQPPVSGGASATGVLPIQIHVPTGGQVYRFAKTIITPDDPLNIQITYSRMVMLTFFKWALFILLLMVVYFKRKALLVLAQRFGDKVRAIIDIYRKHEPAFKQAMESRMTPFILLAVAIFFTTVSEKLALISFLLLVLSLVMHFFNYLERKRQAQNVELHT